MAMPCEPRRMARRAMPAPQGAWNGDLQTPSPQNACRRGSPGTVAIGTSPRRPARSGRSHPAAGYANATDALSLRYVTRSRSRAAQGAGCSEIMMGENTKGRKCRYVCL
jgi:hypothetical protein